MAMDNHAPLRPITKLRKEFMMFHFKSYFIFIALNNEWITFFRDLCIYMCYLYK